MRRQLREKKSNEIDKWKWKDNAKYSFKKGDFMETFLKESVSKSAAADLLKFIKVMNQLMILDEQKNTLKKKKDE